MIPRYFAGRIAALFLLGIGAHGALLFLLGAIGVPLTRITFGVTALLVMGVAVMRGRRMRWRGNVHEVASTIVIVIPFAILLWTTSVTPLADYDGRTTWMPKARAIAAEESIRGPFFHGERGLNLHNRYPLLLPLNAASLLAFGLSARPLFVLVPLAMFLAARDLLAPRFGRARTAWCFAALAWLPQVVTAAEGGATSAYSDLAVAAFFGMAAIARVRGAHLAASLWLAFLILTKNEGLLLALAVLAYRPRWKMFVAPAVAVALLVAWQQSIPDAYDERNSALIRELPSRLAFLDDAALAIGRHALDWRTWGVLWPLVLVCAFARRRPYAALVPLALALAGYVAVMACTSWDIEELARVTSHRLLVHGVVPAACVVLAAMRGAGASPAVSPASRRR